MVPVSPEQEECMVDIETKSHGPFLSGSMEVQLSFGPETVQRACQRHGRNVCMQARRPACTHEHHYLTARQSRIGALGKSTFFATHASMSPDTSTQQHLKLACVGRKALLHSEDTLCNAAAAACQQSAARSMHSQPCLHL